MSEQYVNAVQEIPSSIQLNRLEENFTFKNREEVFSFIQNNPQLYTLLNDAVNPISKIFHLSSLFLYVFHDPESSTGDHLVLSISTKMRAKEALKELDKLDEGWWGENIERAKGMLSIELAYQ